MSSIQWKTVKEYEDITYKKCNGVARIAFNRPDIRNAFRPKTTLELYQAFYDAKYLFTVPPSVFNPPPKVESGVLRLRRKASLDIDCSEAMLYKVVKTAFQQRRKTLRNSLKSFNLSDTLKEDPIFAKRPEQLSVTAFISLTQKLANDGI